MTATEPERTVPSTTGPGLLRQPARHRPTPRQVVASLWLFALLNYLYCDVLGSFDPTVLRQTMNGTVGGMQVGPTFLLASAVLMTIPIAAVLITRIAPHRTARWYSVIAGVVLTLVQLGSLGVGSSPTVYYLYFSVIEVATTVVIAWYAATRWSVDA
ncbi:MAG: DUF6326 family protein [Kineosporiaceae bacterium]